MININSTDPSIKFTIEEESGGRIAFLDTERKEYTKVYRKKTRTNKYISFESPVFSPGFFEGVWGGGAGIRARRWEK